MSATDHPHPRHSSAPHHAGPLPDASTVVNQALGIVAALDRCSIAEAVDTIVTVADRTGHAPLCVAHEVLHLLNPHHPARPHGTSGGGQPPVVLWPLHQRRHRSPDACERVWAIVLAAAAPTQPPAPPTPPSPDGRVPHIGGQRR